MPTRGLVLKHQDISFWLIATAFHLALLASLVLAYVFAPNDAHPEDPAWLLVAVLGLLLIIPYTGAAILSIADLPLARRFPADRATPRSFRWLRTINLVAFLFDAATLATLFARTVASTFAAPVLLIAIILGILVGFSLPLAWFLARTTLHRTPQNASTRLEELRRLRQELEERRSALRP